MIRYISDTKCKFTEYNSYNNYNNNLLLLIKC